MRIRGQNYRNMLLRSISDSTLLRYFVYSKIIFYIKVLYIKKINFT